MTPKEELPKSKLVEKELTGLMMLMASRKICWESEYENGERALGEYKVKDFCESIIGRLETERMGSNLLKTEVAKLQAEISRLSSLLKEADEVIENTDINIQSNEFDEALDKYHALKSKT